MAVNKPDPSLLSRGLTAELDRQTLNHTKSSFVVCLKKGTRSLVLKGEESSGGQRRHLSI